MGRLRGVLLSLALVLAGPVVAQDDDGPGFLTRLLQDNLSGAGRTVTIRGFEGALSSSARIAEMTIADDDGIWLTLRDATLDWSRAALLRGRVQVQSLTAREMVIDRLPASEDTPPSPEARGFALPELPVSVEIGRLGLDRVTLGAGVLGQPVEATLAGALRLAGGAGAADVRLARIDGRTGEIGLQADFANATRELALNLSMVEGPGGIAATALGLPGTPAVDLRVEGAGPLDDFEAQLRLATNGSDRLTGRLLLAGTGDGATRFEGALGGDIAPLFLPDYAAFFGPDLRLVVRGVAEAGGALALSSFNLRAAALSLQGAARIGAGGLPESFAVVGRIAAADGSAVLLPVAGEALFVDRVDLTAEFDAGRGEAWGATLDIADLRRGDVSVAALGLAADGTISGQGRAAVTADLTFAAAGLGHADSALAEALGTDLAGRARIDWQAGQPVALTGLDVAGAGASLAGDATLDTSAGLGLAGTVRLSVEDLARFAGLVGRPLTGGIAVAASGSGDALAGTFDVTVTATGRDLALGLPEADPYLRGATRIEAVARRDAAGTVLDRLVVAGAGVDLDAAGRIATPEGTTVPLAEGRATVRLADVAPLSGLAGRPLSGGVAGEVAGQAGIDGLVASVTADLRGTGLAVGSPEADAYLAGATRLALTASRDGAMARIDRLEIDGARGARLRVTGDLALPEGAAPVFDGRAEAGVGDLSPLSAVAGRALDGAARVVAEGRAAADAQSLDLTADLTATALSVGGQALGDVTVRAEVLRSGDAGRIDRLSLSGAGVEADLAGDLTLPEGTAPGFDGSFRLAVADLSRLAGLAGARLSGALTAEGQGALTADLAAFDLALTAQGTGLSVGQPEADRVIGGRATLTLEAARDGDDVAIRTARLATARGATEASGRLNGRDGTVRISATLDDLGILVAGINGPARLNGQVGETVGGLTVALDATGPAGVTGRATGTVARDAARVDLALSGAAPLGLANPFIAPRSVAGLARYDLRVTGAPALDAVNGTVRLEGGRVVDPGANLVIEDAGGTVTLAGGRATLGLNARSQAGGRLAVAGPIALTAPFPADLAIDLTRLRLTDPALYDTRLSGRVTLTGPLAGGARIGGTIDVGETEVRVPSSGFGISGELLEMVHLDEPPPVRQTRARAGLLAAGEAPASRGGAAFPLNVLIRAPGQVFVRGRGLDAELGGELQLSGTSADPVPVGGFQLIRGRLDLLGKRLDLVSGLARVEGGAPWLELTAEGATPDLRVFVDVTGPASAPEFTFRSEPDLPEDEVLAAFLFGRNVAQLSAFQALQLASAVAELAGRGGEGIVSRLRGGLGLDDLDVSTDADGQTAVRAGRYLGRNVYTDVTVKGGDTVINLNLDVIDNVTIKGSVASDGGTGIGVFYERDF